MKAVFLDRDGTINVEMPNYLTDIRKLEIIEAAYEAIGLLNKHGYKVFVATNQSCINRGLLEEAELHRIHKKMDQMLTAKNAIVDAFYYCKHAPDEGCKCRKPNTGMLDQAVKEHGIDLSRSFFVGDRRFDIGAGKNGGCKTILVKTGAGLESIEKLKAQEPQDHPDHIAEDILGAVHWILSLNQT